MKTISVNSARASLPETIQKVSDDREPIVITADNGQSVVMMPLDDYESWEETAHLLRNPKNRQRLLSSLEELEGGGGTERKLDET